MLYKSTLRELEFARRDRNEGCAKLAGTKCRDRGIGECGECSSAGELSVAWFLRMLIEMLACPIGNIRILRKRMWLVLAIVTVDCFIGRIVAFCVHNNVSFVSHTTLHFTILFGIMASFLFVFCANFTNIRANLTTRPWTKVIDLQRASSQIKCPFTRLRVEVKCPSCQTMVNRSAFYERDPLVGIRFKGGRVTLDVVRHAKVLDLLLEEERHIISQKRQSQRHELRMSLGLIPPSSLNRNETPRMDPSTRQALEEEEAEAAQLTSNFLVGALGAMCIGCYTEYCCWNVQARLCLVNIILSIALTIVQHAFNEQYMAALARIPLDILAMFYSASGLMLSLNSVISSIFFIDHFDHLPYPLPISFPFKGRQVKIARFLSSHLEYPQRVPKFLTTPRGTRERASSLQNFQKLLFNLVVDYKPPEERFWVTNSLSRHDTNSMFQSAESDKA